MTWFTDIPTHRPGAAKRPRDGLRGADEEAHARASGVEFDGVGDRREDPGAQVVELDGFVDLTRGSEITAKGGAVHVDGETQASRTPEAGQEGCHLVHGEIEVVDAIGVETRLGSDSVGHHTEHSPVGGAGGHGDTRGWWFGHAPILRSGLPGPP